MTIPSWNNSKPSDLKSRPLWNLTWSHEFEPVTNVYWYIFHYESPLCELWRSIVIPGDPKIKMDPHNQLWRSIILFMEIHTSSYGDIWIVMKMKIMDFCPLWHSILSCLFTWLCFYFFVVLSCTVWTQASWTGSKALGMRYIKYPPPPPPTHTHTYKMKKRW